APAPVAVALVALLARDWIRPNGELRDWQSDLLPREEVYEAAARELSGEIPPGSRLAMPEIGVLGYALPQAVVLDTVGLVSPRATPYLRRAAVPDPQAKYAVSTEVVAALRPDYVITLGVFAAPALLHSPEFSRAYRLKRSFETRILELGPLLIFERR
ncbi:MAG: hypothetical protein ACREQY_18575, partial [Candidatus Binatia bacterium]